MLIASKAPQHQSTIYLAAHLQILEKYDVARSHQQSGLRNDELSSMAANIIAIKIVTIVHHLKMWRVAAQYCYIGRQCVCRRTARGTQPAAICLNLNYSLTALRHI